MGGVVSGQYLECNTVGVSPDSLLLDGKAPAYTNDLSNVDINCFIHVLRESDGSGGLSLAEVDSMLLIAGQDLELLNVIINVVGQEDMVNSLFFADPDFFASELFNENSHNGAIDIYLGPASGSAKGRASGIPGSSMVLTGSLTSYSALSHLLGNCLGLYPTDESVLFGVENPDGTNNETSGDLITDTAADPGLFEGVLANCTLSAEFIIANPGYNPDPTNIMSNSPMTCWTAFSDKQRDRVLTALDSYVVLQDVVKYSPEIGVYADYTESTNLLPLMVDLTVRSNAVGFDFVGLEGKDLIVSGHAVSLQDSNLGIAFESSYIQSNGVPYFIQPTEDVWGSSPLPNGTTGMLLADYDNDGDLDLYCPNPKWVTSPNVGDTHRLYSNNGDGTFTNVTTTVFSGDENPMPTMNGSWGDFDGDGFLDLLVGINPNGPNPSHTPSANIYSLKLYHNEQVVGGELTDRVFVDVTAETGIVNIAGNSDVFSLLWIDLDQDHDMDLVTINWIQFDEGPEMHSQYYQNNGGTLSEVADSYFGDRLNLKDGSCFGAPGDFDNDGDIDIVYHGKIFRGYFQNQFIETGSATLSSNKLTTGWHEDQPPNVQWQTEPTDMDVFDFDLDGWIDFGFSNGYSVASGTHRLYQNISSIAGFSDFRIDETTSSARGICAADWNMDGFTELLIATRFTDEFFFRNENAVSGANTNHWVGVKLRADPLACNTFGIGATVIITAGSHTQAQIVDGGSGHAGQHDLDLSFGLGSYDGPVNVKVIWPCGQTQFATIQPDIYTILELGLPEIVEDSVKGYLEWIPGFSHVTWVFEWVTSGPSEMAMDQIEFPEGVVMGSNVIYSLSEATPLVNYNIGMTVEGQYKHVLKWRSRPCDQAMSVLFTVHSRAQNEEFTSASKLKVVNCPQSP